MFRIVLTAIVTLVMGWFVTPEIHADLSHIQKSGVLRHLGVPYSNFVTGDGDGLDVEILRMYSSEIGVRYEHVLSSWGTVISDLSGKKLIPKGDDVEIIGETTVKGDIIGNWVNRLALA